MREHNDVEERDGELEDLLSSFTIRGPADLGFVGHLEADLSQRVATHRSSRERPRGRPSLALGAGLAAALAVVAMVGFAMVQSGSQTASAEAILRRAQLVSASPEAGGISTLAISQTYVSYFQGEERMGRPSQEAISHVWYEAPDRMRTESESTAYGLDGFPTVSAGTTVWDGTNLWRYDPQEESVRILHQDPSKDTFSQAFLLGPSGDDLAAYLREAAFCRSITAVGEETVLGRSTDVIELGRASCGWALPGTDGRRLLWIDRQTGLVLKSEQYSITGQLSSRSETIALHLDEPVDVDRFSFDPPPNAEIRDDRDDQPVGVGYGRRIDQPEPTTLDAVREDATFPVQVPSYLPDGFRLESVEHWWANEQARELRSHADWVLLRYADAEGNWLAISQGFGGYISGFASGVPEDAEQGNVNIDGTPVTWIDGNPLNHWEPGTMLTLTWPAGRLGDGWEVLPSGETTYGSPLNVGMSSNVLSLQELVRVAESLE